MLHNLGQIHLEKGELEQALDFEQQSLTLRTIIGNKIHIATSYTAIGQIYKEKNELQQALTYFDKGLAIIKDERVLGTITDLLFSKFEVAITLNNSQLVNEVVQQFTTISNQTSHPLAQYYLRLTRALQLKHGTRLLDKTKAMEALYALVDFEGIDYRLHLIMHQHLVDLLLDEHRFSNEPDVLIEINF